MQYAQIQTFIFVHMLCYIRAYFVYIFVYIRSYMLILLTCEHIFAGKSLSRTLWARMSTYAHICTPICTYMHEYIQYTFKIHARYRHFVRCPCMLYVIADNTWYCICMYMYVYVYMTFIRGCMFGGSSYVPVSVRISWCMYLHVYACIWDNASI